MNRMALLLALMSVFALAPRVGAAAKAKPLVGVYYFPGWYRSFSKEPDQQISSEWRSAIMKAATPRALCGFYNDSDPRLWSNYYIPWMTSHGADFIAFDWYYNAGQEYLYESLDRGLLQSANANDIKFCVHWCNHGGPWWSKPLDQSKPAVLEMADTLCARYFHRPNYLRIDGRPVFMIYEIGTMSSFGGQEAAKETLVALRARVKERGFPNPYLVSVYSGSSPEYAGMLKGMGFDAFCAYTYCWMRPPGYMHDTKSVSYKDTVDMISEDHYAHLEKVGRKSNIPYWPTCFPGWDDRPRAGVENAYVLTDNTPADFGRMFRGALKHVSPASPVVMVEAWNEWGEGACIEPDKKHGFGFLREMANALGKKDPVERVPTAAEIASWSVLSPDELKTAAENESKPWPTHEPRRIELGKSFETPKVKMPFVLDLTLGGIPTDQIKCGGVDIIERTTNGLLIETTSGDPWLILPKVAIPREQVKRITIEAEVVSAKNTKVLQAQVYWTTGLLPEFMEYASGSTPWPAGGNPCLLTEDAPFWKSTGTPITSLRLDPCGNPEVRMLIKRVVLSGD